MAGETMKERVEKLEQLLGEWNFEEGIVTAWASEARNELKVQKDFVKKHEEHVEVQVVSLKAELLTVRESQNLTLQALQEDVAVVTPFFKHTSFKPFQICGSVFVHYGRPINI